MLFWNLAPGAGEWDFSYQHLTLVSVLPLTEVMNNSSKIVFSKTLQDVEEGSHWKNIKLLHEIQSEEIVKLKEQEGKDMTILGSGTIVQQLSNLGLVDEYGLLVIPVILGAGKYLFKDVKKTSLNLLEARSFKNGIVWLRYHLY